MNYYEKTINVNVQGNVSPLKEISFYEYRNLVKRLYDDDIVSVSNAFEDLLLATCSAKPKDLDILQKFIILLHLRNIVVSPMIEMVVNEVQINYPVNEIISALNKKIAACEYLYGDTKYTFGLPKELLPHQNIIAFVVNCLLKIDDGIFVDPNQLPALPFNEITQLILNFYSDVKIVVPHVNQTLSPFDGSMLGFLKSIYTYDLKGLYDIEYTLRRNLGLHANDFQNLSLPECNIMLKNLNDDLKSKAQVES